MVVSGIDNVRSSSSRFQTAAQARVKEMKTAQTGQHPLHINQEQLFAVLNAMMGGRRGREDDEHPLPPGPWDPVIRAAVERVRVFGPQPEPWLAFEAGPHSWWHAPAVRYGPQPDPWKAAFAVMAARYPAIRDVIGDGRSFGSEVALNPQPLPPRFAFLAALAQTVVTRAELIQEIAAATPRQGEQQGIIIVSGYIARFTDDFCGNDLRFRWPFPGPHPPWFSKQASGIDLVVLASHFDKAAREAFDHDLRDSLAGASAKLAEAGLARMQQGVS